MNTVEPLEGVGSIKIKLGVLVGASCVVAALFATIGDRAGMPLWLTLPVTVALALAVVQWLARGMTAPLREMTHAASRMAAGDLRHDDPMQAAINLIQLAQMQQNLRLWGVVGIPSVAEIHAHAVKTLDLFNRAYAA